GGAPRLRNPARRQGRRQHDGGARRPHGAGQGPRADPAGHEGRPAALLRQEERGRHLMAEGATTAPSSGVGGTRSASPAGGTPTASPVGRTRPASPPTPLARASS